MRVLVIDNYDSFTYNLVQYLGELGASPVVWRNDRFALEEVEALNPDRILISPGPCTPLEAGLSLPLIGRYAPRYPILGVCLGHQAIGMAFGGKVVPAPVIMHGKVSEIHHDGTGIFRGLPNPFPATRYHSLVVEEVPEDLLVNAWVEEAGKRTVMGFRHRQYPTHGVQFHPESYLTETGKIILKNFLEDPWRQ
ncbi:aminodeoxychorismate/anthranilate synthase component II [Thermus scotoductus]|uniref:Aminodeoxychorismate/anthranilate synthase component II n=1 Tax=Thermus scotoductus TaxID=37636 RepID=A0A430UUF2_THESC|nr:aminodeoxychorismate/anthranilate synthase component II [Thermus scotoductus]RTG92100.1 aminodeoxychorismate/anthranilate synthase component II [Thermus scotoductus]RTH00005.1 aminodeoxychorismate/anthranilate synthase component II [Thermus scotoductus]RTH28873.1 aminodeoxychorismate/anthranilate synthase component II [Thermus scotoductus]RTI03388.1 aminodeoxychorismate/anthranilate synthase component II [Thermus scotoductus]RTI12471.1 aminodeoxychorismate/anthranilate synthase component II